MASRPQVSRGVRRRRGLTAAGAVLALVVGGGAVAHAVRGDGDDAAAPATGSASIPATGVTGSRPPTSTATPAGRTPATRRSPTTPSPTSVTSRATSPSRATATATAGGTDDAGDTADTAHLTPALARALTAATAAARRDGVRIRVTSGYRTPAHQQQLYEQAIRTYGSARLARRWVLPPAESAHVRGEAVDVGPRSAATWLQTHGNTWGLCRRYDNEWWHFEVATTPGSRCPARAPHA